MAHKGGDFGARHQIGRREFMRVMTAAGATTLLPAGSPRHAVAQSRGTTMVIAAPATPQSLDHEYDVSLGTIDAVEKLTRYLERIELEGCRGVLAAQLIKPQARTLAEARGIHCVEVDVAVLRGEREPELTLFAD